MKRRGVMRCLGIGCLVAGVFILTGCDVIPDSAARSRASSERLAMAGSALADVQVVSTARI